jgi:hypothetical protein
MIEIGDEVETPTGLIGVVMSYSQSKRLTSAYGQRPVMSEERYCSVRGDLSGMNPRTIEHHMDCRLKKLPSEYEQACTILGEDYFA